MAVYFCRTVDRETGESNMFLCVARDSADLHRFFDDDITRLEDYSTDIETEINSNYDGLAILQSL